jgi:hypothetical protein
LCWPSGVYALQNIPREEREEVPSLIGLIMAIVIAAVVLWLLSYIVPSFIAALVALLVFLALTFGGVGERFGGARFGTRARY